MLTLLLSLLFSVAIGSLQMVSAQSLSGTVIDETNSPLPSVNVSLPALHLGTVTNDQGKFTIESLRPGVYTIEFTFIGFKKETRSVSIVAHDVNINVTMHPTALELPGVIVTGKPQPTDVLSSSQSVSVVEGRELTRLRGQNVIEVLENTPGVSTYTTGAGISKPVIRGLTSQRVLVISDGARQEGQQWGDEHAPEIDAFDIKRIEVLRGPSSVLYGSDALGGVVNVIKHDLPSVDEGYSKLGGELTLNGFSNNRHIAGNLSLGGASGIIGYRSYFSLRNAGNITTPEGKLFNSGIKEINGGGLVGVKGIWGAASIDYSHFGQELQIHENPTEDPNATPYQKIQHDKVHVHADFHLQGIRLETDGSWQRNIRREFGEHVHDAEFHRLKGIRLETDGSWQRNVRREFGEHVHDAEFHRLKGIRLESDGRWQRNIRREFGEDASEPALHLKLNTYSLDVKGHHTPIGSLFGTVGISLMSQKNETLAEEKLIPGFNLLNFAGYVYEEARLGNITLSGGLRYDTRSVEVEKTSELNVESQTHNYSALTGAIGLVYRISDPFAFSVNVGRGWRAPSPFELFVDGVHKGTVQYLIGDKYLANEQSLNVDLLARYVTKRVQAELTFYRNQVGDYIYASPTGEIDPSSGYKKYLLKQADATLVGAELSLQAQITHWLILSGGFDFLRGTNDETQKPLPLIPANRIKAGIKFVTNEIGSVLNPYISVNLKSVSTQDRVEEFETPTDGYTLIDVGIGGEVAVGSSRAYVDLSAANLFNVAYRDHLNRYKAYALNPGRNITLKVSVPFSVIH
jgi:iron complex outermembrane receptor protein